MTASSKISIDQHGVGENGLVIVQNIIKNEKFYMDSVDLLLKEKNKLKSLKGQRRLEYLAVRYALQHNMIGGTPRIKYDRHGKPSFSKNINNHVSISHCAEKIAIYIADQNCGIDIQKYSNKILKIRNKFIHKNEQEYLNDNDLSLMLHVIWSAKESLYKLNGKKGLSLKDDIWIDKFDIKSKKFQIQGHFNFKKETKTYKLEVLLQEDEIIVYTL